MIKLILTGIFLVKYVDFDAGVYNILLENPRTGDLVAYWQKEPGVFIEGKNLDLRIEGECDKVYEVLEGNGKRGSPWRPEDDWYVNRRPYICNANKVEIAYD